MMAMMIMMSIITTIIVIIFFSIISIHANSIGLKSAYVVCYYVLGLISVSKRMNLLNAICQQPSTSAC